MKTFKLQKKKGKADKFLYGRKCIKVLEKK